MIANQISLVAHADWSVHDNKRWLAEATRRRDGSFLAYAPEPVGDTTTLIERLLSKSGPQGAVLAGFDFPIGLPAGYAELAGIANFIDFLAEAGQGEWASFFDVANTPDQISLQRPFYPMYNWIGLPKAKAPTPRHEELTRALGVRAIDDLRRQCDLAHAGRRAAAPLFWTLGAQQVGKAAITGWQEVLQPHLPHLAVWPFSGPLEELLSTHRLVAAETYPAEFYTHLGVDFTNNGLPCRSGKRDPQGRAAQAPALLDWAHRNDVALQPELGEAIQSGFGPGSNGEDPFDAVVGLFGMLNVVLGNREEGRHPKLYLQDVEGWILGQASS